VNFDKKYCEKCRQYLPIYSFKKVTTKAALSKYPDGYYWCCSSCYANLEWVYKKGEEPNSRKYRRREKRIRRIKAIESRYGLTQEEHQDILVKQNNLCAICQKHIEGKVLCVDHDHTTGKVRGLLCGNCNVGLGNFKDNTEVLQAAIAYLQKYGRQ
jgi:hypothetical protein